MDEEVVVHIEWTESARRTFSSIIDYLLREWSDREVENFLSRANELITLLKRYPEMCRPSRKRRNVRIAVLNRQTRLAYLYQPKKRCIRILLFWNPKENPANLKY